jgi:SAM-dependent methyltransferase
MSRGQHEADERKAHHGASAEAALGTVSIVERHVTSGEAATANRRWWDADADDYYAAHGEFLGEVDFVWCPEGLREDVADLLGDVRDARVLEIGCGSASCARWLAEHGAWVVGLDISAGMLRHAIEANQRSGIEVPLVQAGAERLPFAVTHPIRWIFPDHPGPEGLTVAQSYFDRTPYVEVDAAGVPTYVEHHRTLGDRIREIVGAGLALENLVEPEWPPGHEREWGQWSPLRGALFPGTAIFCCRRPA